MQPEAAKGKLIVVKAGDTIPFKGVQTTVVISDAKGITKPLNRAGTANPACKDAEQQAAVGPENQRMVGLMVQFGKFRLLNLQDLDWERDVACLSDRRVGPNYAVACEPPRRPRWLGRAGVSERDSSAGDLG